MSGGCALAVGLSFMAGLGVGFIWAALSIAAPRARHVHGEREEPVPAPLGYYWQVAESGLILENGKPAWGKLYLVPFGRMIDEIGFYVDRSKHDWPPMPRWSRLVDREKHLRRESIRLLREMNLETIRKSALNDTRRRLDEQA